MIADTSAFLAVALSEPEREKIISVTQGVELLAPEILPYEVGNALSALCKRQRLDEEQVQLVHEVIDSIPVRLVGVDVLTALQLAMRYRIYAYDAYFLECGRVYRCPLLTLDRQMQRVASDMGLTVVEFQ